MSNYESIVPEDIASNIFDFHGASIRTVADAGRYYEPYSFFTNGHASSNNNPPPIM